MLTPGVSLGVLSPRGRHRATYSSCKLKMRMLTPGVSLGVLSPQGRHSATYNEHMPMKELHPAM